MRKYIIYQLFLIILYMAMIAIFSYMSTRTGTSSGEMSQRVAEDVAKVEESITGKPVVVDDGYVLSIRKIIGHFGFFTCFGIVSALLFLSLYTVLMPLRISIHYVAGILFAFISEYLLEGNTKGRTASIRDVGLDTLGFIGVSSIMIIGWLIIKYIRRKKESYNSL